jgi:hypothetical protein
MPFDACVICIFCSFSGFAKGILYANIATLYQIALK